MAYSQSVRETEHLGRGFVQLGHAITKDFNESLLDDGDAGLYEQNEQQSEI